MDSDNWGERRPDRPVFSKTAIVLAAIASQLLPLSFPWFVVAAANDSDASVLIQLLSIPMGLFLILGPYVVVLLSYWMLYKLPAGNPIRGRLLVWFSLGCGYAGAMWSLMLFSATAAAGAWPFAVVAAIVFLVHLAIFASESTGARYISGALLLLLGVLAVFAPAMVRSRTLARRMQLVHNLKEVGLGFLRMESVGGTRSGSQETQREIPSPEHPPFE